MTGVIPAFKTKCPGCKVVLPFVEGPQHGYMEGSAACFELFNHLLACEYSDPTLLPTHRLTVDTYAVQHPGAGKSRKQIQSVGLHLARLGLQLDAPKSPTETNEVMLGLGKFKHTIEYMPPPEQFTITVADVAPFAGTRKHSELVRDWAHATWNDWSDHHSYIREWTAMHL